jgi:hypothetical protein
MPKLFILGDVALNGLFIKDQNNNYDRIKELLLHIDNNSISVANLEVPIAGNINDINPNRSFYHSTTEDVLKYILPLLNIQCLSLANNHIYDHKLIGLDKTIGVLKHLNIKHTGAGFLPEHIEPVIIEFGEFRIGFLAYLDKSTNPGTEPYKDLLINYFDVNKVIWDIKTIRNNVDKIICSIHWGKDYSSFFTQHQQMTARNIVNAGADIIMGHHPHTYQPYELYKQSIIFYSLGQLCYGDDYWQGELRALKRKSKTSYLPVINETFEIDYFIKTREGRGNYIKVYKNNYFTTLNMILYQVNKFKLRSRLINFIFNIKESVIDRLVEYFFGYYRNPIKQLLNYKNFNKLYFITRDFKKYNE